MAIENLILLIGLSSGELTKLPFLSTSIGTILDLSIAILALIYLIKLKFKLKKPPLFVKLGLAFSLFGLLTLLLTPLNLSLLEYGISAAYPLRIIIYLILGWAVYSTDKKLDTSVFLYSGFIMAIVGLIQLAVVPDLNIYLGSSWDPHVDRTVSTLLDPNFTGGFLVISLLILTLQKPTKKSILMFLIIYLAFLTTFSRSASIALGTSFLALTILKRSIKIFFLTCALCVGILISYYFYQINIAAIRNVDRNQSAQFRLTTWQQGLEIISKNPIKGVGLNSYRFALREYNLTNDQTLESRGSASNDSSLLTVTATTGVLGLLIYVLFIGSSVKLNKPLFVASLCGIIAQGFFINTMFYPWFLIWMILSVV